MEKFWLTVSAYDSRVSRPCSSSGNFCGSESRHGIFRRLHFGPRNFFWGGGGGGGGGGLFEALGIFLDFDYCPHSIIPVTCNLEYPLPLGPRVSTYETRVSTASLQGFVWKTIEPWCDWVARSFIVTPMQILLTFGVCSNFFLSDY